MKREEDEVVFLLIKTYHILCLLSLFFQILHEKRNV